MTIESHDLFPPYLAGVQFQYIKETHGDFPSPACKQAETNWLKYLRALQELHSQPTVFEITAMFDFYTRGDGKAIQKGPLGNNRSFGEPTFLCLTGQAAGFFLLGYPEPNEPIPFSRQTGLHVVIPLRPIRELYLPKLIKQLEDLSLIFDKNLFFANARRFKEELNKVRNLR